MKEVKYSPDAREKLKQIKLYVKQEFGIDIANKVIKEMMKSIRDLMRFENKGASVESALGISCDYRMLYIRSNHQDAFREILLNAIVHKDYSSCNPIQISVYEDKIYIWNDGEMPSELNSTEKLFAKHSSKPYNPKLAGVFFKSGMIEAWGRGFEKIQEACARYDGPLPEYHISASGVMVLCKACERYLELLNDEENLYLGQSDQDNDQDNDQDVTKMIIAFCIQPHSAKEIMNYIQTDDRSFFRRHYLNPMIKKGLLKRAIPDKPSSKNQKYYSQSCSASWSK